MTTKETAANLDSETLLHMFRQMVKIREFEEAAGRMAEQAKIPGAVHLYVGEEAVAVGVCNELTVADAIASTHRGHGHCIAKGGDVKLMFAELYGRATGYCHGKGGSMHIADLDLGILGANGIVAGGAPMAMGAAFASKYKKDGTVCVLFCGDGATNEGAWHEAMNFAGLYQLPLITIVENNHWGEWTRQEDQAPITELYVRAASYGMPGVRVDGQDILAVNAAAREAVDRARSGGGPTLIECDTYRFHNHMGVIDKDPRDANEIARWKARDPIDILRKALEDKKLLTAEGSERIVEEIRREIEEAVAFAEASPFPDPADLLTDVFTV
ncbi:MAG TPA: thiamine pyrophosphate-dependent dehydrogenase E1 component subunit alpha [Dehalococcoidia bacterium]|nr:thiamine pyrophosphate-dependent dehydrogenase E1 component subunit alpha [Dehalococcoidia bacterium]